MKKYQIITQKEEAYRLIQELTGVLSFELENEGSKVFLQKQGNGISLQKKNGEWTIHYGKLCELARAWYLMYCNDEKEEVSIEEQLVFEDFGVMLDCSRNAVMKVECLKDYIKQLALMGYHTLELYTEDTFKVDGEPYFGYMRGAYSVKEIQEIDAFCKMFGMELVPCIQTLAHINQITRYEHYKSFVDVNDILLVGDERTYELIEHIIAAAAKAFSSRRINIGMDEAHMLGLGKYLDEHGYHERFPIMVEHLKRVQEILKKYGFEAHMWSDMFFRLLGNGSYTLSDDQINQELFDLVPKNIELFYWDYYSRDYNHYERNIKNHYRITEKVGFAAGAWKWTGFAPDNGFSQTAGRNAIKACIRNHVSDFLVTCWGDNGAEASAFSVLPTLYLYAQEAYGSAEADYESGFKALTGYTFLEYMKLDSPNQLFEVTDYEHGNACKYFLYNDVFLGTFDSLASEIVPVKYKEYKLELAALAEKESRFSYLFTTLADLCDLLEVKANLGVRITEAYKSKDKEMLKHLAEESIPETLRRLDVFLKSFRYQWHKENKSFGFEIQLIRIGGLKERILYAKEQILNYLEGRISQIEELEEEKLPFAYFLQDDPAKVNYNLWNVIVSPAVLG